MTQTGKSEHGAASPLRRDRNFNVFWVAQILSVTGDSFAYIAIPLLVLHVTGSVTQMGLLTGVAGAASVFAGIFAGILVDRLDRRTLLICCDLARMVLYGLIPLAWAFGPQIWLLYVVLPISEAVGMVFQVTYVTAVRNLVDDDRITAANGRLYATSAMAGIGGPLLAGVVSGQFGPTAAIAINAVSFALSAACIYFVRFGGQATASASAPPRQKPWQELLAGARFLWRHPVLRTLTILLSFFIFFTLGLTDVLIYYLKHDLGQSDGMVGMVLAVAAVGTIAGSLLVAPIRRKLGFGTAWIGGIAVGGLAITGIGVSGDIPVIAALMAVYLACVSVGGICSMSLRQQVTPDHLLGRVTSAFWTIHFSLGPVGAAVLTWGAGRYGVTVVCLFAGAACLIIAIIALFTPVRQPNPEHLVSAD
ncbi:Predicted arabinose efflux permease, MFS family [Streptosporangium subroseum]|uniref:Predicted arabinose efflux permease, MFS family n=1 Tax=Streptosporangium subroseum TaxID=106412 RepID=A0A239EGE4_9ACTN|nr:MFS transporter [Streptosporangium subroseum]SNS43338.1 Predicted arabinose efflux permease, MFS family [Streptosporangium subroseum]